MHWLITVVSHFAILICGLFGLFTAFVGYYRGKRIREGTPRPSRLKLVEAIYLLSACAMLVMMGIALGHNA